MSARNLIARRIGLWSQEIPDPTVADSIISALTAAGYSIIHDSENHGPTVERAAKIALSQIKELGLSNNPAYVNFEPSEITAEKIYLSIRAMTTGGRDAE